MKINVLRKTKNELKIEIFGEGHTFCNILQKTLLDDSRVDMAGYNIPHPLTANATVYIRTRGRTKPATALKQAMVKLQKETSEFRTSFRKVTKE